MEESDPDLVFTALREAQEEVGIDPAKVKIVGQLTELFIPASRFIVYPVIGLMEEKPNWILPGFQIVLLFSRPIKRIKETGFLLMVC